MDLIKLTTEEYTDFVDNQKNKSFYQTLEYARFLGELDYEYDFIGLKDNYQNIHAASLIAYKKINNKFSYAYAPCGFLIDYNDIELLKDFAKALKKFYKKENLLFIKINPNIIIGRLNKKTKKFDENDNVKFKTNLKKAKYQELKDNQYFESVLPKYHPIVDLKTFSYRTLEKNVRNKISKCYRKGLSIEHVGYEGIETLYPLIKNKSNKSIKYYQALYHSFENQKKIDIFLVAIDFNEYLINMKDEYQKELDNNSKLMKMIVNKPSEKTLDLKMQSDKLLLAIKNSIIEATNGLANNPKIYIAGGIVIKYKNDVNVFETGYDKKYKDCNANYFLHYKIMEYYKYNYDYLDLNGFSGNLDYGSKYSGLNNFKLGFKPDIYETIGEYDIVYNHFIYNRYIKKGILANIFKNN
jgi:lipid II:glycine glycyltransferase (peptidoglycan interpeptide bridge formation enzyme)